MTDIPELLWRPDPDRVATTRIAGFRDWLRTSRGIDLADYEAMWRWSVTDLPAFWAAVADHLGVRFHARADVVLESEEMPGTKWFPGATLNYAEHALTGPPDTDPAVVFHREDGVTSRLTYGELRAQVAAARAALVDLGVRRGDRVAALV